MENVNKIRKKGDGSFSNVQKKRRASGQEYIGRSQVVEAKKPPPDKVSCKCRYKCKEIDFEQKLKLFNDFYDIGDSTKQNSYLMELMSVCEVKRRRHGTYTDAESSRRQATIFFTVSNGKGETLQVCRRTFLEIHCITKRRVETLVKAKKSGDIVYIERRGNKKQHRKYSELDEQQIVNHINSFPKEESHYTRAKNSNEYLSQDLNYSKLFFAFKELHPNSLITIRFYTDMVKKHFPKLKFQRPRKDTCGTCDLLHNQIKSNKEDKNTFKRNWSITIERLKKPDQK
ncbi:uncharacterized protein LOC120349791 isoform X1 [Nilaparvata lugens]|uniref:uncharacterized protein LOC120349791 isoform X1 n=1 Tax=Nilaparvata lugens TaxID=108931 RepID=UPI00193E24D1|nr:uncharacterized protein LOC120349791 isoform X1 [Nilaparvata lugens]